MTFVRDDVVTVDDVIKEELMVEETMLDDTIFTFPMVVDRLFMFGFAKGI